MSTVQREIKLQGAHGFRRGASSALCGSVMNRVDDVVRRSVRMAFAGTSSLSGRPRAWFTSATDLRFMGFEPGDEAVLHYEVSTFGESAPDLYRQQELWPTTPPPEWTAFEALAWVLDDANQGRPDSDRYDRALLRSLGHFGKPFAAGLERLQIEDRRAEQLHLSALDPRTVRQAKQLSDATPAARMVQVSGRLDMLRVSTQTLGLKLSSGEEVRGALVDGDIESLQGLLNQDVILQGKAVYRPSGALLRIDTTLVTRGADENGLFARVPGPLDRRASSQRYGKPQTANSGLAAAFGKWPGEESDEELLHALESLS